MFTRSSFNIAQNPILLNNWATEDIILLTSLSQSRNFSDRLDYFVSNKKEYKTGIPVPTQISEMKTIDDTMADVSLIPMHLGNSLFAFPYLKNIMKTLYSLC